MATLRLVLLLDPEPPSQWFIRQIQLENDHLPVEEFLNDLPTDDAAAFLARFRQLLRAPPFPQLNTLKKLRHVQNVYEVISQGYRIFGFRNENQLILTNGHKKKTNSTPPGPIKTCIEIQERYLKQ